MAACRSGRAARRCLRPQRLAVLCSLCSLVTLLAGTPVLGASAVGVTIAGWVRDPAGAGVADVRVLVLEPSAQPLTAAVAETSTDEGGRFELPGLAPGFYRLAALKQGYGVALAQVRASARAWLDLVLEPLPPGAVPESASWVLRLPRRSILREEDPLPLLARARFASRNVLAAVEGAEVEQHLAWERSASGRDAAGDGGWAAMTRVQLSAGLGKTARMRLEGAHERYGLSQDAWQRSEGTSGALAFDSERGTRDHVQVRAFYRRASGPVPVVSRPLAAAGRDWGYAAQWSRDMGAAARLEVAFGTRSLGWAAESGATAGTEAGPQQRILEADGMLVRQVGAAHRLRVFLRARRDGWEEGLASTSQLLPAWQLDLGGEDIWQLRAGWSVRWLLQGRYDLARSGASAWFPGMGVAWAGTRAKGGLDLVGLVERGEGIVPRGGTPLGYRARVGARLPGRIEVFCERVLEPVFGLFSEGKPASMDGMGPDGPVAAVLSLLSGDTTVQRETLGVERGFESLTVRLRFEQGELEAREPMAAVFAVLQPAFLADGSPVEYARGQLAFDLHATGTRMVGILERIGQGAPARWYELQVAQPLYWLDTTPGTWRVLLAARRIESSEAAADTRGASSEQIRAGVSLSF